MKKKEERTHERKSMYIDFHDARPRNNFFLGERAAIDTKIEFEQIDVR